MTFSQLYNKLVTEAKEKYPNSKVIQNYDTSFNMDYSSVSQTFTELVDFERGEEFIWSDDAGNVITDETLKYITEGFTGYMEFISNKEI